MPQTVSVTYKKPDWIEEIEVYVCGDIPYFEKGRESEQGTLRRTLAFGLGGLRQFVDENGKVRPRDQNIVGEGVGGVGAIIAIGYRKGEAVRRSYATIAVRKGILYPTDVWRDGGAGPFLSKPDKPVESRFAFQTRPPNGNGSAIFTADYYGRDIRNLTGEVSQAYNGFRGEGGVLVAEWIDEGRQFKFFSRAEDKGYGVVTEPDVDVGTR